MVASYSIRRLSPTDQQFLREMLYQSLYVTDGSDPFPRDVVDQPEIVKYVKDWGREGDLGFVAIDSRRNKKIGTAWLRLFRGNERGYAYVDDETPELGIAVLPECRGQGVGTDMLKHLFEAAAAIYPSVSLSVSPDNPALRLYERMGFKRVGVRGNSVTMIKNF